MKELTKLGVLDTSLLTVTGQTVSENIKNAENGNPDVIRPVENPYSTTGGLAILWGNIAPDGCVVKRSAVTPEMQVHSGPARVFNSEETAIAAIYAGQIVPGDLTTKSRLLKPFTGRRFIRATWWSFATKARGAARGCAKC